MARYRLTRSAPLTGLTRHQDARMASLVALGLCGPCARAVAQAGYTGTPALCHDCEGLDNGLRSPR